MSVVFVADLHLAPLTWQDQPEIRGDAYAAWLQLVEYCCSSGVKTLLIGGDIFDKARPDSESVEVFETGMDMLANYEILVYFIQGNHDRADPPWASALSPLAKYIGNGEVAMIDVDGTPCTVRGYDNMPAAQLKEHFEELCDLPENPDIVLIHQLEKTFVPFEGSWDFDMGWVPEGVRLVLGGDYHEPVESGRLWYSGSTYSTTISEFTPRSFLHIHRNQHDGTFNVGRVPLQKRIVLERSVITDEHLAEAVKAIDELERDDQLPECIQLPLVFIRCSTNVTDAVAALEDACARNNCALRLKVMAGGVEVVGEIAKPTGDVSLAGCMAQVINREEDEEFYSFALALLTSPSPGDVLTATKARLGVT